MLIKLYALYGGLAAGLFEETGRLLAFRFILKPHTARITALSYGIGHGGIEAFWVMGLSKGRRSRLPSERRSRSRHGGGGQASPPGAAAGS